MNKLIFCCVCLLGACAIVPKGQQEALKHVVAEAKAKDCNLAMSQAKINAADNAAGTFVHGQRTLLEDRHYSESLNEYTSGVVRRYNVLEKSGDSPCRIKIEAWVEPGRAKVDLPGAPDSVGVSDINQRAKQIRNNQAFLAKHFRNTQGFRVRFGNQETLESQPNSIRVVLDVVAVQSPRGWLEDMESFISIHASPVVYEPISRASALSRLFTFTRESEKGKPAPWDFEICFKDNEIKQIRCYTGEHNRKIIRVLRSALLEIVVEAPNGLKFNANWPQQVSYYTFVEMGTRYRAAGYEPRSDFPLLVLSPSPSRYGLDYPAKQLPPGATISGIFRFSDVGQFPENDRQVN